MSQPRERGQNRNRRRRATSDKMHCPEIYRVVTRHVQVRFGTMMACSCRQAQDLCAADLAGCCSHGDYEACTNKVEVRLLGRKYDIVYGGRILPTDGFGRPAPSQSKHGACWPGVNIGLCLSIRTPASAELLLAQTWVRRSRG